jgi:hypothetical protein
MTATIGTPRLIPIFALRARKQTRQRQPAKKTSAEKRHRANRSGKINVSEHTFQQRPLRGKAQGQKILPIAHLLD